MKRRTICLSALAVTSMLLASVAVAQESAGVKTYSPHDFAPYYQALHAWQNEPVGQLATVAFEQADGRDAAADGSDSASIACDCGCEDCETCSTCCCPPLWKARLTYFSLIRDLGNAPIVTNGGATVVSAGQFDTGYEPGVEFSLRGPLDECDFQVRYIHSDSFNEAYRRARAAGDFMFPGTAIGPIGNVINHSYQSRLYNLELNFLRPIPESNFEVFAGLAYLRYEEAYNYVPTAPVVGFIKSETENDLYGVQVGGNALLYALEQFSVEAMGRAGIFYARSKSEMRLAPATNLRDSADNMAFLGEMGLLVNYLLFGNTSIEASYHALWLSGGALAGEQISTSNNVLGVTQLNQGEIFFHGFNLGVATRW